MLLRADEVIEWLWRCIIDLCSPSSTSQHEVPPGLPAVADEVIE
jgi:hypothetical protein